MLIIDWKTRSNLLNYTIENRVTIKMFNIHNIRNWSLFSFSTIMKLMTLI